MKKLVSVLLSAAVFVAAAAAAPVAYADYLLKGDVNKDGNVTLRDATIAQRVQVSGGTAEQVRLSDVNGDGSVSVMDAYIIQRCATGDTELLDEGYCPNRDHRLDFYAALNEDRASYGLKPYEPNDAVLAAGQELCETWFEERLDPENTDKNHYSGLRVYTDSTGKQRRYDTVFEDYGITRPVSIPYILTAYGQSGDGGSYYSYIKKDIEKYGVSSTYYSIYNDILMTTNPPAICVGEHYDGLAACWVIVGYL